MTIERFEMRIDSELLDRLDHWRNGEDDVPSRAEAVRRLIEAGLAHDNQGRAPVLSDGEKLIAVILSELVQKLDVNIETDVNLVQKVIYGGHYWALGWEMSGIFHGHADKRARVRFVVDVLDMWQFIEEASEALTQADRERVEKGAYPFSAAKFPGFDGNEESEYFSIACFIVEDLNRFRRFREEHRDLNSHHPTLESYGKMVRTFEPIRKTLIGRRMNVDELVTVLSAPRDIA